METVIRQISKAVSPNLQFLVCINETKLKILFIRLAETTNWWLVSQVYPANMFCLANTKIRLGNASVA